MSNYENKNTGNKVTMATEVGREVYEASVMQRMQGRSGAYTPTGSKGIALEVMHTDKINAQNLFNPDVKASLAKKANATQVDAVVMKGNKVIGRNQYKDVISDSGTRDLVKAVKNGDYGTVKMYGTTESVQKFNQAAQKAGINKRMIDTGISSNTTKRIGDKFTGQLPKASSIGDLAKHTTKTAAALTAGIEVVKSINNGDSVSECAGNVVSKVGQSAVSVGTSAVAADVVATILSPLGPVAAIGGGLVTSLVVNEAVCEATEDIFEEIGMGVSNVVDSIGNAIEDIGFGVSSFFGCIFGF